jgi:hypothetical protein
MASSDDLVAAMTSRLRSINAAGYSQGEVDVDVVGPKFSTHQMIGRYEIKIAQACFPEARGLESDCQLVCRAAVTGSLCGEGRVREWILGKLKVLSWPFERNVSAIVRDKSRNTPYGWVRHKRRAWKFITPPFPRPPACSGLIFVFALEPEEFDPAASRRRRCVRAT